MPKGHPPYAPEFRRRMVELARADRSPEELSREFEPTAQAIWNWVRQAERDAGRRDDGLPEVERTELIRLRRENRQLRQGLSSGLTRGSARSCQTSAARGIALRLWR